MNNCDKRSSPKNLRCSAEMHSARNTLCAELSSAYIWIKICRQAGVGILHADISLMQIIIIKNNRLCDNSFADTIWVSFNNAVRDSFSRLSLPSPDVSLDLAPCARSRLLRRACRRDSEIWTTSGDACAIFTTNKYDWENRCFVFVFY